MSCLRRKLVGANTPPELAGKIYHFGVESQVLAFWFPGNSQTGVFLLGLVRLLLSRARYGTQIVQTKRIREKKLSCPRRQT